MLSEELLSPDRLQELLGKIDPAVLQRVMPLTGGVATMMFTDIVGSTELNAEMGDEAHFHFRERHNPLERECVFANNRRELKTIGDIFVVGFFLPADAVACAIRIGHGLATSPSQRGRG